MANAFRKFLEDCVSDAAEAIGYLGHRTLDGLEISSAWACGVIEPELLCWLAWLVILSMYLLL